MGWGVWREAIFIAGSAPRTFWIREGLASEEEIESVPAE
jgi:hypothetical protein